MSTLGTPSANKKGITALCSSLVQMKFGVTMFVVKKTHDRNGLSRSHLHHNGRRGVEHVYFVTPNQQYSQLQTMYL
jgi:hypothetical protein